VGDFVTVFKFDGLNPRQHLTGHLALPENHMKYLLLRIVMLYEHNNNRSFATDGQPTAKFSSLYPLTEDFLQILQIE